MPKPRTSSSYWFRGIQVTAFAAAGHLDWLDEFLLPWFDAAGPADTSLRVRLIKDDAAHATLAAGAMPTTSEMVVVGFVLDGPPALLELRTAADGKSWLFDRELNVLYRIDGRSIRVLAPVCGGDGRFALVRVIRELVMERAFSLGAPVLHAAAIAYGDRAALVLGDRGAGKTTFSVDCVVRLGCGFIANDRVTVINGRNGRPSAQGMPTLVRVRRSSFALLPGVPWTRLARPYSSRETLAEALRLNKQPPAATEQPLEHAYLSPAQHCWLLGTHPIASKPLGLLLFPRVDTGVDGVGVERLTPDEALARLHAGTFNGLVPTEVPRAFAASAAVPSLEHTDAGTRPEQRLAQRLEQICSSIPAYECRLGASAYTDTATLPQLFDAHS